MVTPERGQQRLHWQRRSSVGWRRGSTVAVGPGNQLTLVCEEHPGNRHQKDDASGGDAGDQMRPEDKSAQCHVSAR
jgi:hypothetical protein